MESQRKKKLFNILMIAMVAIIALGGIIAVTLMKDTGTDPLKNNAGTDGGYGITLEGADEALTEQEKGEAESSQNRSGEKSDDGKNENTGNRDSMGKTPSNDKESAPEKEEAVVPGGSTPVAKTCTIEIRCDTVLNNMDKLKAGKEGFIPNNGTILQTTTVEFEEGDTVFDVLAGVCSSKGIQLEYSWSPVYGSSYIEGINHLYEYDCGDQSGWIFKVNGTAPNYGASAYTLEDGDSIRWLYSCVGYGSDV